MLIPNTSEVAGSSTNQARPDSRDFAIIEAGGANYGVASGATVNAQGTPDGTVVVGAGSLVFSPPGAAQVNISIPAQNANVLTGAGSQAADSSNPRIDLVVVDSAGTVSVLHGTPAAVTNTSGPVYPTRTAIGTDTNGIINKIVLARIDVRAGVTTVTAADIIDKRFFPQPPVVPPVTGQNATIVFPGQLTQSLVTAAGAGASFILKAGVHTYVVGRCTPAITPLDNQTFIGEPGAILDGAMIKNVATVVAGTLNSTLIISGYSLTAGVDDQTGTTPTYVWGMAYNQNAGATINSVTNSTTAVLGDTMAWTRQVTDGVTTNASTTLTSATAGFVANDVGADLNGTNIPANTTIASVTNGTTVVMSNAATATGSAITVKITQHRPGAQRSFTDAVTTNASPTLTSATAAFSNADLGAAVSGTNIPANTSIKAINSATSVTMNNNASASGSAITVTLKRQTARIVTLTRAVATGVDAAFKGTASNVTIKNLIIQNFPSIPARGAIHPQNGDDFTALGDNWVIEDCEIRNNAGMGLRSCNNSLIRHNRIHDNGDMGNGGNGKNVLFERNEVYYNNAYNVPAGFDACGMKFALTQGLIVRGNRVHDNLGLGIWTDVDCFGSIIEYNDVYRNDQHGISIETCYNTRVHHNNVWGNGLANSAGGAYDPGNILVSSSSNVEVDNNVVGTPTVGNYHGILVLAQDRVKVTSGGLRTVTDMVTNGTTTITSATAAFTQADRNAKVTGTNIPAGPPVTTIVSVTNATTAVLSVAATGSGSGGTLNIQQQLDQYGALPGAATGQIGASGWYQRTYNVEIHHNHVTTTGTSGVELAGLASDIGNAATAGYWLSRGIRFHSNTYNYTDGGAYFGWSTGAFTTMAQWQSFGMDQVQTQLAPGGYTPTTESIQEAPDYLGTAWKVDALMSTQTTNITGSATIDLSLGLHQRLTVSGNVTALTISNVPYQGEVILEFINGGTNTRVNTATNMRPAGAAMAALTSGSGKTDIYTFTCDGTNIIERSRSLNC